MNYTWSRLGCVANPSLKTLQTERAQHHLVIDMYEGRKHQLSDIQYIVYEKQACGCGPYVVFEEAPRNKLGRASSI